jgi:hypothetical protein
LTPPATLLRTLDLFALRLRARFRFFCLCFAGFFALCLGLTLTGGEDCRLPDPENVALAGAPKIPGCNAGAALHESPLEHSGGNTGALTHGTAAEHTCASYTS